MPTKYDCFILSKDSMYKTLFLSTYQDARTGGNMWEQSCYTYSDNSAGSRQLLIVQNLHLGSVCLRSLLLEEAPVFLPMMVQEVVVLKPGQLAWWPPATVMESIYAYPIWPVLNTVRKTLNFWKEMGGRKEKKKLPGNPNTETKDSASCRTHHKCIWHFQFLHLHGSTSFIMPSNQTQRFISVVQCEFQNKYGNNCS